MGPDRLCQAWDPRRTGYPTQSQNSPPHDQAYFLLPCLPGLMLPGPVGLHFWGQCVTAPGNGPGQEVRTPFPPAPGGLSNGQARPQGREYEIKSGFSLKPTWI